ncbi:MAG TPA: hypothetical protein VLY04_12640 [Bryobacteraceae bacterium]|nr:hypothetical protein [Bryobacteraceae bacterium]
MNRILVAGLLVLAAGVYAQEPGRGRPGNWRFIGAEAGRPGPVVKNAPFSADVTTETTQVLADGNRIHRTSSQRLYRDSEGRTRREQSLESLGGLASNANLPPVVFINDPVAGVDYALSPASRTTTKTVRGNPPQLPGNAPGPGRRMARIQSAENPRTVKNEALGRQTIEGVAADGTRNTTIIPAGQVGNEQPIQIVTEAWYSPDLHVAVLIKRSDPRTGDTITRYTNINRSEPPHSLFEVPADYKISESAGPAPRPPSK